MDSSLRVLLVAVDGSTHSEAALDMAARLVALGPERVYVVTVQEPLIVSGSEAGVMEILQEFRSARSHAVRYLDDAIERLRATGLKVEGRMLEGAAKTAIVNAAKELNADLVVLGASGHGWWECGLGGCTACWVTKHAPCSVLVVRRPEGQEQEPPSPLLAPEPLARG